MAVLLQYAEDDGEIKLWDFWGETVSDTLELIEWIATKDICGFNLAFDWFHIYKIFTTFNLLQDQFGPDFIPEDDIDAAAIAEEKARDYQLCLRPESACDLFLHARKGQYQNLMRRKPIVIR